MSNYRYEGYGVVRDLRDDFPYHTDDIVELLDEKDQQITELKEQLRLAKMNESFEQEKNNALKYQKQITIAELEQVKKLLVEKMKLASDKLDCAYYIDNQIKELRGEENE